MPSIAITLSAEQAEAVRAALDLYTRLCLGQVERVADLVRDEVIPLMSHQGNDRRTADESICAAVASVLREVKFHLSYPAAGSMGIAHPHVHLNGRRAYEVERVLSGALAHYWHRDARASDADALDLRLTSDPLPRAQFVEGEQSP